jgi:tRNA 2-selenouridine synthase
MTIEDFLQRPGPILDIRSPSEFIKGHIPGAISFPLFTDAERIQVGTLYKKEGRDKAVKLGLQFVGPKLSSFVEQAEKIAGPGQSLRLYCWRGGMRSQSMTWLLQTAGFSCTTLVGGYKTFRHWTHTIFKRNYSFTVLGGFTGSGKTALLQQLSQENEQVIDLEAIAKHRGSSFGHLGQTKQPTTEHFENELAWLLSRFKSDQQIWIEDESRLIGACHLPLDIWQQMYEAPFLWIDSPKEERIKRLLHNYSSHSQDELIHATQKLIKKLGTVKTTQIIQFIEAHELEKAIDLVLDYYDQAYSYSCQKRNRQPIESNAKFCKL